MNDIAGLMTEYANEVNIATSSFFTWKSINNTGQASKFLWALNKNALTWNIIVHSLQVTFFIAIGRIFDKNDRSLTVHRFLAECKASIDQFSKGALEKRRLDDAHGVRPDYLDDYLKTAYEPTSSDFSHLEGIAAKWADIYHKKYAPVRHKIVAHKDFATIGSGSALFANTNIGEFEEMLGALDRIGKVVWQLHANARLIKLEDYKFDEEGRRRRPRCTWRASRNHRRNAAAPAATRRPRDSCRSRRSPPRCRDPG